MNRHSTIMSWTAQRKYIVIITALLIFTLAATGLWAQALPPDIQADQYLLAAKKQLEAENYAGAAEYFEKILALGVKVPTEFYYHYGKTLLKTQKYEASKSALSKYVTLEGRTGKYYTQALELLTEAEKLESDKKKRDEELARKKPYEDALAVVKSIQSIVQFDLERIMDSASWTDNILNDIIVLKFYIENGNLKLPLTTIRFPTVGMYRPKNAHLDFKYEDGPIQIPLNSIRSIELGDSIHYGYKKLSIVTSSSELIITGNLYWMLVELMISGEWKKPPADQRYWRKIQVTSKKSGVYEFSVKEGEAEKYLKAFRILALGPPK